MQKYQQIWKKDHLKYEIVASKILIPCEVWTKVNVFQLLQNVLGLYSDLLIGTYVLATKSHFKQNIIILL